MLIRSLWVRTPTALLPSLFLTTQATPRDQETTADDFRTPLDIRMGERLFQQQCGRCHGRDGAGGELGPDLTSGFR
ncbi:MAG: c-type cytochrome, partial [Acidobacteriota bacterium]|nr:c-type cytochrome [Acidobacteriota bacterium]